MAKDDKPAANPLQEYVAGTGGLLTGFAARTAAVAPPETEAIVQVLGGTIQRSMDFLSRAIDNALGAAGVAADEIQEMLDSFGATELLNDVKEQLAAASTPADVAAVGTLLPLIKKIIRFIVDIFKLQLPVDLDKILEFVDELATAAVDFVSPRGAEAMHRAEVRFLEAQYHLDRLGSLQDVAGDGNGR